jgi:hypothetical protein
MPSCSNVLIDIKILAPFKLRRYAYPFAKLSGEVGLFRCHLVPPSIESFAAR